MTPYQARVLAAIAACRTAQLGGHVYECDSCGHLEIAYNSCRNRHCATCQRLDKARWLEARESELLPVEYHHVVFTIPAALHPIFRCRPTQAYNALFRCVAETLKDVALNPSHLGATIGFIAVLHTWTQTLAYHPHVHVIVPGGGLTPKADRWIPARKGFFLPVRVLSVVFRGKLLAALQAGLEDNSVPRPTGDPVRMLRSAARKKWVVYSKPPVAGPKQVLGYLGRYVHRVAISDDRLVALDNGIVSFSYRDRSKQQSTKTMRVPAPEFLRRLLLHVLPPGFVKIRYYGLLSSSVKQQALSACRSLLSLETSTALPSHEAAASETWQELLFRLTGIDPTRCPNCRSGRMVCIKEIPNAGRRHRFHSRATAT